MIRRRPDTADSWYRRLLRLFPSEFRGDFGDEMSEVFRNEHADARRGGDLAVRRLWWRTITGVLRTAPRRHWDAFRQDAAYAVRLLLANPGFGVVAIVTIALGIGANVAVFGFINALLWQQPATPAGGSLVRVYATTDDRPIDVVSYPDYCDLRDRNTVFSSLALHRDVSISLAPGAEPETIIGELVSGNYFSTLGVRPALGRLLMPEDDRAGAAGVVVISHRLWMRRFGSNSSVVGRALVLNGSTFTIAGVAAAGFQGTHDAHVRDLWVPVTKQDQIRHLGLSIDRRTWGWLWMTGRLKPGITIEQARAQISEVARQMAVERGGSTRRPAYMIYPAATLPEDQRQGLAPVLGFSMAVTALVLLVACANIAGVLQARLWARRRELAIRQALGAARGRLARQWLTESLIVAAAGGLAGIVAARWMMAALAALPWPGMESAVSAGPFDLRAVGFGVVLIVLTAILFGLFPALGAGAGSLSDALTAETPAASGGRRRARGRRVLVTLQVAASLLLLVIAGLLTRSLQHALAFDPGFRTYRLVLVSIDLRRQGYAGPDARAFQQRLLAEFASTPGVQGVTSGTVVPLDSSREGLGFTIDGQTPPAGRSSFSIDENSVGTRYFSTMDIPLVAGREFDERDSGAGASPVAIVNETMARRFWPGENPIGRHIGLAGTDVKLLIVGVARDIKYYTLTESPRSYVYLPQAPSATSGGFDQDNVAGTTVHVRSAGDPRLLVPLLRDRIRAIDPNVTAEIRTFEDLRREPLFPGRAMAATSALFGLLALVLSGVGLYGTIATSVAGRVHEIGLRLALGAQRRQVFAAVVGEALALVAVGLAIGAVGAMAAAGALRGQLFGVLPVDPLTYIGAAVTIVAVAAFAAFVPARRAARVDPVVALRHL